LPLPELPEHGALFVLSHGALGAAAAIERMYPGQQLIEHRDPPPRTWWFDAWWPLAPAEGDDEVRVAFYPVPRAVAEHPQREPPPRPRSASRRGASRVSLTSTDIIRCVTSPTPSTISFPSRSRGGSTRSGADDSRCPSRAAITSTSRATHCQSCCWTAGRSP